MAIYSNDRELLEKVIAEKGLGPVARALASLVNLPVEALGLNVMYGIREIVNDVGCEVGELAVNNALAGLVGEKVESGWKSSCQSGREFKTEEI